MSAEEDRQRWMAAAHAVQTGVMYELEYGSKDGSPKQLRTGVNMALCDHAGLVRLLVGKGVFTEDEYLKAIADEAEREVARYEERLTRTLAERNGGDPDNPTTKITLG